MDITSQSIQGYMETLEKERQEAVSIIVEKMRRITQREPKLWGTIIGFGKLYYKYQTGHDGFMPILGLSSRKQAITLYLSFEIEKYEEVKRLGKCSLGRGCLYIKRLSDVDMDVLVSLMEKAYVDALKYDFVKVIE